jgi:hypothetical protein
MKKFFFFLLLCCFVFLGKLAHAEESALPRKGWHKGPYLTANFGISQVTNDPHVITGRKYNGNFLPSFGLTFGWDINDWIGPMLQANYATTSAQVGDPNNDNNNGEPYPSNPDLVFAAGTFPVEKARQHVINVALFVRATHPYFTNTDTQPKNIKFIPYAKLGGSFHGMIIDAPTDANKVGAIGGGPSLGLGLEFFIWKGFIFVIDTTAHLTFQDAFYRNINTNRGPRNLKVVEGGFKPHFDAHGLLGWHF